MKHSHRRTTIRSKCCSAIFAGLLSSTISGCGRPSDQPDLAPVSGVVTLDGVPVPGKDVVFSPQGGGRASIGKTNAEGQYELMYTAAIEGAIVGPHTVTISTPIPAQDGVPYEEDLPAKFNVESTLTADVLDQDNVINFSLESE